MERLACVVTAIATLFVLFCAAGSSRAAGSDQERLPGDFATAQTARNSSSRLRANSIWAPAQNRASSPSTTSASARTLLLAAAM